MFASRGDFVDMSGESQQRLSFGHRWMSGAEVRQAFIDFFGAKQHRELQSSSLVPHNDPTVLLTTAGMQQMTPYFLGLESPPDIRLTSVQKCFRTVDIDEVGDIEPLHLLFHVGQFLGWRLLQVGLFALVVGVSDRGDGFRSRPPLSDGSP